MADKQLKLCEPPPQFFHATDVLILDTTMKKLKLSRLFILRFVLQNENG